MKKLLLAFLAAFSLSIAAEENLTTYCSNYSRYVYQVAVARDNNTPRLQLKEQTYAMIDEGKVKTFGQKDKPELGRIIDILYGRPDVTPEYGSQTYFQHCLTTNQEV